MFGFFKVWISTSSWVIRTVLKVNMAIAMMEMPMVINLFGLPGTEISDFWERALMMSQNSSNKVSMVARLMSVTYLVMALNVLEQYSK
jgi:hypothetical protein